jgi:hypothetical protein
LGIAIEQWKKIHRGAVPPKNAADDQGKQGQQSQ